MLCIFLRSIYMFSIFYSAFSYIFETSLYTSYFDEEICIDIDSVLGHRNCRGSFDVEIAINRGNRIILSHATWKAFIVRRADIE